MTPSERLRAARKAAGFAGPKEVAETLDVTYGTYSAHERGYRNITVSRANQYARYFNTTAEWLLHGTGRPPSGLTPEQAAAAGAEAAGRGDRSATPSALDRKALRMAVEEALEIYREQGILESVKASEFADTVSEAYDGFHAARRRVRTAES